MKNYPASGPGDSGSGPRLRPAQLPLMRAAGLAVLAVVAAGALLVTLEWGKEGFGTEDLPLCGAGLLLLAAAGGAWWLLCRRASPVAHPVLFCAGIALLVLPASVYSAFGTRTLINLIRAAWLERHATISGYRETPIVWRGLPGSVGLRIELDLTVPARLRGNLLPPRLALGGPEGYSARDYFSLRFYQFEGLTLGRPVFQSLDPPGPGPLAAGRPLHLMYDLYPGYVQRVADEARVCQDTAAVARARQERPSGRELSASWFFAGPGGLTVDLSPALTATLRARSGLAGRPGAWDSLLQRLTPSALGEAGFAPCPLNAAAPSLAAVCWCRGPA